MILLLHNRYRTLGGEERVVDELLGLIPEQLGEPAELLGRDSAALTRSQAARGMLRGGLDPDEVGAAVRRTGARVVHAHNVNPAFGWRALAAARAAGARTVLHLHQYRLVCAVGTCMDPAGSDCTRCSGRNTTPGLRLRCRGALPDAAVYAAAIARWSPRLVAEADVLVAPSAFAVQRLHELNAPLGGRGVTVIPNPVALAAVQADPGAGTYAMCSSRLAAEKGLDVAIRACAQAGVPLVITGNGEAEGELRALASRLGSKVRFTGRVEGDELAALRAGAGLALVPSRFAETFGLSAAEAMACGLPVVASRLGALPELLPDEDLAPVDDVAAWAELIAARFGDRAAGARNAERIGALAAPKAVGRALAAVYDG